MIRERQEGVWLVEIMRLLFKTGGNIDLLTNINNGDCPIQKMLFFIYALISFPFGLFIR